MKIFPDRFIPAYFFLFILLILAACEANPATSTVPAPTANASVSATATNAPTLRPGETRTNAPTLAPTLAATRLPSPTTRSRGGAITIAGTGALSNEITALPDFVADALFDSLLRVNANDGSLQPALAERWTISQDSKTLTFTLRTDVKWHDGQALTADDVVFTLETLSDAKTRVTPAADFGTLENVSASDARTVTLTFDEPYCAALTYIGRVKILPKHILEKQNLANVPSEKLIGSGPLILKTWQDNALTFQANAAYWNGAPWIADWTYRVYPNERAANDAVRLGQADIALSRAPMNETARADFAANAFYALAFNTKRAPFDDARVRQALASALDRAQLASEANATMLETSLLPAFWAHPQNIAQLQFDAARARQLLSDAGWRDTDSDGIVDKNGKSLIVTLWAHSDDALAEATAQRVRAQLQNIGVQAVLKLADRHLFLTRVFLQEYDLAIAHFNLPLDPDQTYFWSKVEDKPGYGLNVTGYANASVQEAMDAGNTVAQCAPDARKKAYAPVWQQLAADVPMVFLFAPPQILNTTARAQGIAPSSFGGAFWNLEEWSVAP